MFFKQIRRNAAKNRKGNGLFFASLIIAIIAFYTLLSLGEQDVMQFLATIESDAVRKLMRMLPIVYGISLFFVFFLVYFACRYQTDSRRRELGMYLMLGMKRGRLFAMLFGKTLWSSTVSLIIGLPVALFLTEGISLATAKIVGRKILKLLMENYPDTVGKSELFSAVWGTNKFVDENILQVNISRLRKSLSGIGFGDAVRNIRGKGYVLEVKIL